MPATQSRGGQRDLKDPVCERAPNIKKAYSRTKARLCILASAIYDFDAMTVLQTLNALALGFRADEWGPVAGHRMGQVIGHHRCCLQVIHDAVAYTRGQGVRVHFV